TGTCRQIIEYDGHHDARAGYAGFAVADGGIGANARSPVHGRSMLTERAGSRVLVRAGFTELVNFWVKLYRYGKACFVVLSILPIRDRYRSLTLLRLVLT